MAVIYTPSGQNPITIGGTNATGPFPAYSISRTTNPIGEGYLINNIYSITIEGSILINASIDPTVSGAVQSDLHRQMIAKLQTGIDNGNNLGRLEIVPYGGQPNAFDFIDARLVRVDIPKPEEDDSLNSSFSYVFEFEATVDASNRDITNELWLSSIEETWDVTPNDTVSFENQLQTENGRAGKTYSINHTVSATGRRSVDSLGNFDSSAWKEAKEWVKSRLVDSPAIIIASDFFGGPDYTLFNPLYFNNDNDVLAVDLSDYNFYNHVRIPSVNLVAGSYTITESWTASLSSATMDFNVDMEEDSNQIVNVSITGSIQGYDSAGYGDKFVDKYTNANNYFKIIEPNLYLTAQYHYLDSYSRTLRSVPLSKSIGRNIGAGSITFSVSYDDADELIENAISSNVTCRDDNQFRDVRITAIIPIISKLTGPEIQDMNTTKERRRSVTVDCVMQRDFRTEKPAQARELALSYKPDENAKIDSYTDDFDNGSGTYSLSIEWVY